MTAKRKHVPNTSPERLAEIRNMSWPYYDVTDPVRDLIAMIEERNEHFKNENTPRSYRTLPGRPGVTYCLHGSSSIGYADALLDNLRWRKLSEEEPTLAQIIVIEIADRDPEELPYQVICFGVDEVEFDRWFSLPKPSKP